MAKRKNHAPKRHNAKEEDLSALYAKYRQEFTAADLQKYTEVEIGIPAEKVLAQMEAIHRRVTGKRKKR